MKYKIGIIYIIIVLALLEACGGSRPAATPSPYARQPIKEVTAEQLAADGLLIDALALQESGRTDQALDAYAALTRKHPDAAAAWYEMGQLLLQRGWTDSALACARRAVDLQGDNVWYLLALAQTYGRRSEAKPLAATWERIVALHPDVLDYHYELSNAYISAGDIPAAVDALDRVERRIGITEPISLQKQRLWQAAGKDAKAVKEIEKLAAASPNAKRYNAILAETAMRQKQYAKAKAYYDRILQDDPADPYVHIQLAELYKATNQPDKVDAELLEGFANAQLDSKSKIQLLQGFYTNEDYVGPRNQTIFRLVDMAMAGVADSTELAAYYGNVLMFQEKYAEAARQFELALNRDSSDYAVWDRLLICLAEMPGDDPRLVPYATRAAALFPMQTLPHFLLAVAAIEDKRYDDALKAAQEAERWGFSKGYLEVDTYNLMAEAYYRTGQYDRCWSTFDRCLKLQPDNSAILNNYAYYLAEQGLRLDEAERMSRRSLETDPANANNLDTYAWILHLMGRHREALPHMQRAADSDPANETFSRHLKAIKDAIR